MWDKCASHSCGEGEQDLCPAGSSDFGACPVHMPSLQPTSRADLLGVMGTYDPHLKTQLVNPFSTPQTLKYICPGHKILEVSKTSSLAHLWSCLM